jgi:hypothetical protein
MDKNEIALTNEELTRSVKCMFHSINELYTLLRTKGAEHPEEFYHELSRQNLHKRIKSLEKVQSVLIAAFAGLSVILSILVFAILTSK